MACPPFAEKDVFWGGVFIGFTTFEEESIVFCVVVSGDVATRSASYSGLAAAALLV